MSSENKEMDFYKSFLLHRRATLDFVKKLQNTTIELPNFTGFSLQELQKRTARLLVVSELDALASFIYGHNESKKAFIDMLIEWTEIGVFSAIWPKKLVDFFEDDTGHSDREVLNKVKTHIQSLKQKKFQNRDEYNNEKRRLIERLRDTNLNDDQCEILSDILWRISDENGINSEYLEQYEADLKKKESRRKYYQYAKLFFDQLGNSEFLKRGIIAQKLDVFLQNQRYDQKILNNTKNLIVENLHHGSYAACMYKFRCDCTHRFDGQNQSFSDVTYNGKPIENIDFNLLVNSYNQILTNLEKIPIGEIKKMHDKYAKSQEGIGGIMPLLRSNIYQYFKDYES